MNAENPYQQVMIRGRVVEITHEGADKHIDSLAKKYLGVDKYPHRAPVPVSKELLPELSLITFLPQAMKNRHRVGF